MHRCFALAFSFFTLLCSCTSGYATHTSSKLGCRRAFFFGRVLTAEQLPRCEAQTPRRGSCVCWCVGLSSLSDCSVRCACHRDSAKLPQRGRKREGMSPTPKTQQEGERPCCRTSKKKKERQRKRKRKQRVEAEAREGESMQTTNPQEAQAKSHLFCLVHIGLQKRERSRCWPCYISITTHTGGV